MTAREMLRKLGYENSDTGISTFQRDFNRLGGQALLVTGQLDEETSEALRFAHASGQVFTIVRDRQGA